MVRNIKGTDNPFSHTNAIFLEHKILKMQDLVTQNTANFVFKILKNSQPQSLKTMFKKEGTSTIMSTRNRTTDPLKIPYFRREKDIKTVMYQGPVIWNSIPDTLRMENDRLIFKELVKDRLLQNYWLIPPCEEIECISCMTTYHSPSSVPLS